VEIRNYQANIPSNLEEIATKRFMVVSLIFSKKVGKILNYGKVSKMSQKQAGRQQKNIKHLLH